MSMTCSPTRRPALSSIEGLRIIGTARKKSALSPLCLIMFMPTTWGRFSIKKEWRFVQGIIAPCRSCSALACRRQPGRLLLCTIPREEIDVLVRGIHRALKVFK